MMSMLPPYHTYMIQVQIASRMNSQLRISVVHPSHIMSAKQQSASKIYDQRPVLNKEQVTNGSKYMGFPQPNPEHMMIDYWK
jgi:hypothetical protein